MEPAITLTPLTLSFGPCQLTLGASDPVEPLFALNEVCAYLGFKSAKRAADNLPDDVICYRLVNTSSGIQRVKMITEEGFYELVFRSRLPRAKSVRSVLLKTALPGARKTGWFRLNTPVTVTNDQYSQYINALKSWATGPKRSVESAKLAVAAVTDFQNATGLPQTAVLELMQASVMMETA